MWLLWTLHIKHTIYIGEYNILVHTVLSILWPIQCDIVQVTISGCPIQCGWLVWHCSGHHLRVSHSVWLIGVTLFRSPSQGVPFSVADWCGIVQVTISGCPIQCGWLVWHCSGHHLRVSHSVWLIGVTLFRSPSQGDPFSVADWCGIVQVTISGWPIQCGWLVWHCSGHHLSVSHSVWLIGVTLFRSPSQGDPFSVADWCDIVQVTISGCPIQCGWLVSHRSGSSIRYGFQAFCTEMFCPWWTNNVLDWSWRPVKTTVTMWITALTPC